MKKGANVGVVLANLPAGERGTEEKQLKHRQSFTDPDMVLRPRKYRALCAFWTPLPVAHMGSNRRRGLYDQAWGFSSASKLLLSTREPLGLISRNARTSCGGASL